MAAMLMACSGEPSRIVSDEPVDKVILGGVLCEKVTEASVLHAFNQAGILEEDAHKYSYATENSLMIVPYG